MTQTLASRIRRIGVATIGGLAASALLVAPQAAADSGDKTLVYSEHGVELATDACPGGYGQVAIEGFPDGPDKYDVYFGGDGCTMRAKFVGVRADGRTVFDTGYETSTGEGGFIGVADVYRCSVEFGLQRRDGTFYTRTIIAEPQENPNCPE